MGDRIPLQVIRRDVTPIDVVERMQSGVDRAAHRAGRRDTRDWKGGEVEYCQELVRTGGNESVPFEAVLSYLELQRNDAKRGSDPDALAADVLGALIRVWCRRFIRRLGLRCGPAFDGILEVIEATDRLDVDRDIGELDETDRLMRVQRRIAAKDSIIKTLREAVELATTDNGAACYARPDLALRRVEHIDAMARAALATVRVIEAHTLGTGEAP